MARHHRSQSRTLVNALVGVCGAIWLCVGSAHAGTYTVSNTSAIDIHAAADPLGIVSSTDLYPSAITFSGIAAGETVSSITVELLDYSATDTNAIMSAIAKEGSTQSTNGLLFDGPGAVGNGVSGLNLTFDASSANRLPTSGTFSSGTYAPDFDNTGYSDVLPPGNTASPSPSTEAPQEASDAFASGFSAFDDTNPNGTYLLYANDFYDDSSGTIAGGWTMTITTIGGSATAPEAGTLGLLSVGSIGFVGSLRRRSSRTAPANRRQQTS